MIFGTPAHRRELSSMLEPRLSVSTSYTNRCIKGNLSLKPRIETWVQARLRGAACVDGCGSTGKLGWSYKCRSDFSVWAWANFSIGRMISEHGAGPGARTRKGCAHGGFVVEGETGLSRFQKRFAVETENCSVRSRIRNCRLRPALANLRELRHFNISES